MEKNLKRGIELIKQVENEAAVSVLLKSLEMNPRNPEVYRNLGLAYFNLGNYKDALVIWMKSIELDPSHHQTLWNIGNLYEIDHKYKEAFNAYSQAAELAEKSLDAKKAIRYKEWAERVKRK